MVYQKPHSLIMCDDPVAQPPLVRSSDSARSLAKEPMMCPHVPALALHQREADRGDILGLLRILIVQAQSGLEKCV